MGAERVDVGGLDVAWRREWQTASATIRLGEAGGRWLVWHSQRGPAWAFWDERAGCERVERLMGRARWTETPVSAGQTTRL